MIERTDPHLNAIPGSRVPGRIWTVRLTGHSDHSVTVTCSNGACHMPPRSRDTAALRRFAAQHARAHARLVTVRPNAACACRAADCSFHEGKRASCHGAPMLILIHNPAVGQVWTLAETCQACAPLISNTSVLARAAHPPAAVPAASSAGVNPVAAPAVVPGGFSSPGPAPEAAASRRPRRRGASHHRGR